MDASHTMSYRYQHPRPAVSADVVIFAHENRRLKVLLIQRGKDPFSGQWALPGGFLDEGEDLDETPIRELQEETGLAGITLEQVAAFGNRGRDPRTRVISVAYSGLARLSERTIRAGDDAAAARWSSALRLPPLAFDHNQIVKMALRQFRMKLRSQPALLEWLPGEFSWDELPALYEMVLNEQVDSKLLQKQLSGLGLIRPTGRPDQFRFDRKRYRSLLRHGISLRFQHA